MSETDPIKRFRALVAKAQAAGEPQHATAMTLATCSPEGRVLAFVWAPPVPVVGMWRYFHQWCRTS